MSAKDRLKKDLKNDKTKLAEKFSQQQKSLVNLEERIADAERYKRRWCLCLYGLSEQPNKDVKAEVLEICNVLAPESCQKAFDVIDIAHRLGKPQPGRIRAFIILFSLRSVRDAVWRNGKNNEFLKQRKLRFMEDLTKEEKDKRSLLWQESV
ncbi:ectonucleoside triphosphate diphosphohydrolase 2-like protein [Labeo rohita]|uniref:Ectonucleoside triphosphate diphosphohydrolase 2-like protein n=1 Tax=Labeo rohita TaxID=84645 RepID=A0A498MWF0_LABRO|nr:ectonucleoside triphosphate diphosphohydrolase 2-like protein [Labeo rohita]